MLVSDIIAELNQRPNFRYLVFSSSTPALTNLVQALNSAGRSYYEKNCLSNSFYEKSTLDGSPIVLPSGVAWGASSVGKIYELTTATTGALPSDFIRVKQLTVLGDSGVITDSSSTYDTQTTEGNGIISSAVTNAIVFHKQTGRATTALLRIYAGSNCAGAATTHVSMIYQRDYIPCAATTDLVDVPPDLWYTAFMAQLNPYLQQYFGFQ